jgi:hypothetical protein
MSDRKKKYAAAPHVLQFFPWPTGHDRGNWYREVRTYADIKSAKHNDALTIIYPSGTEIKARVFSAQRNLDSGANHLQTEAAGGKRHNKPVAGLLARSTALTHKRRRK